MIWNDCFFQKKSKHKKDKKSKKQKKRSKSSKSRHREISSGSDADSETSDSDVSDSEILAKYVNNFYTVHFVEYMYLSLYAIVRKLKKKLSMLHFTLKTP